MLNRSQRLSGASGCLACSCATQLDPSSGFCALRLPSGLTLRCNLQGYTMVEGSPRWRRGTAAQEAAFAAAEAAVAAAESPTAAADRSELDARQVLALRLSITPLSHQGYLLAESYCLVALRGFALHSKSQPTDITNRDKQCFPCLRNIPARTKHSQCQAACFLTKYQNIRCIARKKY